MGIQVSRKNAKTVTAVHQTGTWDGTGVDTDTTYAIHTYRWYRKLSDWDYDDKLFNSPVNVIQTDTNGILTNGYYIDSKMQDGATVYYGSVYKQADEYILMGEAGSNFEVGHIRKIKGGWKFRSGHDCRQYQHNMNACDHRDSAGNVCGSYGDQWKD
tara:strand:- start:106 stop:576 length:471 start_codon:yes stop_codon:yes gene_type:complete